MIGEGKFSNSDSEEDEESANWQDSYSDLMTDLLAIFVVLFSFAMMSQAIAASKTASGQTPQVVAEVSAIEQTQPGNSTVLDGQESVLENQGSSSSLAESLDDYIDEAKLSEQLSVTDDVDNLITLRVASSLLFDSGRADINSKAEPMLSKVTEILEEYKDSIKMVRIEGHTDNIPISNTEFDSNWELSTSRALSVLKWIAKRSNLDPKMFSAVGYSEYHPIADNNTEKSRSKNRRVDFVIETKATEVKK